MIKPTSAHYNQRRKTSTLYFDDRDPMECSMRGGICWPITYENAGRVDTNGYAVMCGYEIKTGNIYVFEQIQWITIDHIIDPETRAIKYEGTAPWFNSLWNTYYAKSFYYHQSYDLSKRFVLAVGRSPMIGTRPRFVELPPTDAQDIISALWMALKAGKLFREGDTELQRQMEMVKSGDKQVLPAVHAMGCALVGIERFPWRKPYVENVQEVLVL